MKNAKYIVDSSVFVRKEPFKRYDKECYPKHWANFDKLVDKGIIVSIDKVKDEITDKGYTFHKEWVKKHKKMFYPTIDNEIAPYLNKLSIKFPNWYGKNEKKADYYLVAHAKVKNLVLVTQEGINLNASEENYKIHTVCYKLGARCIPPETNKNHIFCQNKEKIDFECVSFNELVKREKLYR